MQHINVTRSFSLTFLTRPGRNDGVKSLILTFKSSHLVNNKDLTPIPTYALRTFQDIDFGTLFVV